MTKDGDFRASHLLARSPRRLLLVATGNITNDGLLRMVEQNLDAVVEAFADSDFVEIHASALIVHDRRRDDKS